MFLEILVHLKRCQIKDCFSFHSLPPHSTALTVVIWHAESSALTSIAATREQATGVNHGCITEPAGCKWLTRLIPAGCCSSAIGHSFMVVHGYLKPGWIGKAASQNALYHHRWYPHSSVGGICACTCIAVQCSSGSVVFPATVTIHWKGTLQAVLSEAEVVHPWK